MRMRHRARLLFWLVALLSVGSCVLLSNQAVVAGRPGPSLPPPPGAPAIRVTPSTTPTCQQVRGFYTTHHVWRNVSQEGGKVASIEFLKAADAEMRLHASTGLPASAVVIFVTLNGTFVFSGPAKATKTYPYAFELFDAATGNLVLTGGLPKPFTPLPGTTPCP
jgi:hypothetical protein